MYTARPIWKCIVLLTLILVLKSGLGLAQSHDTVKVMAYNLLNYPDASGASAAAADTSLRNPFYRTVVQAVNPDIMVIEELNSQAGLNGFLANVMNANGVRYAAASYINSNDTDRGLFYRTSKFQLVSHVPIITNLRDINAFTLVHIASGDTLRVYAVHLKASTGVANEQQRLSEVDSLRKVTNALPAGANFIVCGDFNFYGSTEPAYQKLLQVQSGNQGHFYDALNLSGTWNNPAYAPYHTQSPRIRSFGGGVTGGMDDRFDLILYSKGIADAGGVTVVPNSLTAFGNDGNHYNDSINAQPNTAVPVNVANALHNAADHLPVVMRFDFSYGSAVSIDAGVSAFVQPVSACPDPAAQLKVRVKNYSASPLNFSQSPVTAVLKAVNPSSATVFLSQTLNSGSIAAGADTLVSFSTTYNMSAAGSYSFRGYIQSLPNDVNPANDSSAVSSFSVVNSPMASISPSGAIQICNGGSAVLTSSAGSAYSWSTGANTSAITVSTPGTYQVTVTYASGCTSVSAPVLVTTGSGSPTDSVFYENMGVVSATTTMTAHETANGFLNDQFTMTGSADVRSTLVSSGYSAASGGANVFITNIAGRNFQIADINTANSSNLTLSFGIYKSTSASTGSDFRVQVSTDGVNYTDLSFAALPTGSTGWFYRTAGGVIPSAANLRIRFLNTATTTQYRIDDVLLTSTNTPSIVNAGNDTLCSGDVALLTASAGNSYLWSTGATTQSVSVAGPGSYSVIVDCISSAPYVIQSCASISLYLHFFIEGYYSGAGQMRARLYESGLSADPSACESFTLELHQSAPPYATVYSTSAVLSVTGQAHVHIPLTYSGQSFYIVVKGQAMLETWSKTAVTLQGNSLIYDFETP